MRAQGAKRLRSSWIGGYLTTILVTLVPPLWHRLMVPKLVAWDRDFASEEERALAAEANAKIGIPALTRHGSPEAPAMRRAA